jgi:Uma2 family endonuclease
MAHVDVLANDSVRTMIMPISVEQYHKFSESGLIAEKTELIEGIIFKKMTKSPLHEYIAHKLYSFFLQHADKDVLVRKEAPLTLATSEPEPDISLVRGRLDDFIARHPGHAELVIEVAVSSLELDREKAISYASAVIPEYWIVIPQKQQIERYTQPAGGHYRSRQLLGATQSIVTTWGELVIAVLFE